MFYVAGIMREGASGNEIQVGKLEFIQATFNKIPNNIFSLREKCLIGNLFCCELHKTKIMFSQINYARI